MKARNAAEALKQMQAIDPELNKEYFAKANYDDKQILDYFNGYFHKRYCIQIAQYEIANDPVRKAAAWDELVEILHDMGMPRTNESRLPMLERICLYVRGMDEELQKLKEKAQV